MSNLQIVGYEVEAYDQEMNSGEGGYQWYDVAISAYGGTIYLDAFTGYRYPKVIQEKEAYCKRRVIPYFRIKTGSTDEMRAKIETALIQLAARMAK